MAFSSDAGGVSLSKLLLQSRGADVIKRVAIVNAFTQEGKAALPVKLLPNNNPDEEIEITLNGKETLTTVTWNIASQLRWDGVELCATPPQSQLLEGGAKGEIVPIKSTGMLNLLVETTLAREEVRRLDVLEASLESVRSMLLCQRPELHLRGTRLAHSRTCPCATRIPSPVPTRRIATATDAPACTPMA